MLQQIPGKDADVRCRQWSIVLRADPRYIAHHKQATCQLNDGVVDVQNPVKLQFQVRQRRRERAVLHGWVAGMLIRIYSLEFVASPRPDIRERVS